MWVFATVAALLTACHEPEPSVFTGNEVTYGLVSGSEHGVSGTVTLKERRDGATSIVIVATGTDGTALHPVHLHLGFVNEPDMAVAALLSPLQARTGRSETVLTFLADETPVTFGGLTNLVANIRIHLADTGPGRDVILAGGNIGKAIELDASGRGLNELGVCRSE
jgi:hypothetical protein